MGSSDLWLVFAVGRRHYPNGPLDAIIVRRLNLPRNGRRRPAMPDSPWLIYGANGYTGQRIAREAANRRMKPILAGRNAREIGTLAAELKCPSRVFSLSGKGLADHLRDVRLVLNCAGPFTATGEPMMDACLAAKAHYLDITGEIPVIEAAAARHDRAVQAGVSVIPACGFDVVPSDCLAAMLAARLPGAIRLELAFAAGIRISRGTARTIAERIAHGGQARQDGKIVAVPLVWKTMQIPFRGGPQWG
jgi:saccharopine dehydrogenase (NAD+, L-lysine-forming)